MRLMLAAILLVFAFPAAGQTIAGPGLPLDGDTLLVGDVRVRLWGIDAPEMSDWPLGAWARASLDRIAHGTMVRCEVVDTDRYKRPVAVCGVPGYDDLARYMLIGGWAVVYRRFTGAAAGDLAGRAADYDQLELSSQKYKAGIWRDY